ncbi:ABC-type transport auxiliary lipoprotein family protein [Chachezhania antarctica]|uniref:ABC-type transport auxiliary lipoprotein family protein n=1 Tax=Chachezhania antarctica TaxID=2340860 RepID=UPI001F08CFC1|nr:ABC-type transport auxiliary lipoprotein family protein [Chachezhania antarctica]
MMYPRFVPALLIVLVTGACAGLGVTTPTDLYLLTPKSTFARNLPNLGVQIVVEEPTASAAVNTNRIAVQPTPLQVQYVSEGRWVDRAPLIVQSLLIESFENTGKVSSVGQSAVGIRADYTVITDLREFQAQVISAEGDPTVLQVDVRLNIKVLEAYDDHIIASSSFEEAVISVSDETPDIVKAFDEALGDAMRDAVEWTIRRVAAHSGKYPPRSASYE